MSGTIDNRVVSMRFDNRQFEQGVATTLGSLSRLKNGLNLQGATKGLEAIDASSRRISFDSLSNGVEAVKVKFSALQVAAVTALVNISNSAINAGKNIVSSLTIDPIIDGFREYETQMNAVQTILANTSHKGTTLKEVNAALSELNEYSDKTIYNFTEMTKNIGTFTAAGVDLKTSTAAIKGIANLAAVSGSTSEQASNAMYQLSQALAAGKVGLQDWNSVVNAGMGGEIFQNALKETAKTMGIAVDESVSFRESISAKNGDSWLTSEVLTKTLEKFTGDMTEAQLASEGYTKQQIADIIKMGQVANDAATKIKTFTQLMSTLKEAVGSGWAQTWQILFGDFEEAKTLFTSVGNTLGEMIVKSAKARNDMLKGWKDLGGRTILIDAIKNAFDGVMGVVKAVGGAFRDIFPATTSAQLFSFTVGLKNLTENLKLSDSTLNNLKSTFKGAFAILDIGKTIFLAIANAVGILFGGVGNLGSSILGVTGSFGEWLTALDNAIKKSDVFNKILTPLAYGIKNGFTGIAAILTLITNGIGGVIKAISEHLNFPGFEAFQSFLGLMGNRMTSIGNESASMATTVGGAFVSMGQHIANSKIGEIFLSIWDTVKMVSEAIGTLIGRIVESISTSLKNADFNTMLDGITAISIGGMLLAFKKFIKGLSDTFENSKGFLSKISGVLDDVRGSFEAYQQNLKAGVLIKLGVAIALLAGSIVAISLIDSGKLASSLAAIGTLFAELLVAMKLYTTIGTFQPGVLKASVVMLSMSTSILILSGAMKNLASLDWNGIAKGTVGIAALSATMVASSKVLSSGSKTMLKGATQMVIFAASIKILADVCKDLAQLNWEQLKMGLIGVGVLMAEISLFLNTAKFSAKSISTAIGIMILGEAMKILASACADFGSMNWGDISKGLKSIGILLAEMTIFTNVTANAKNVISTGVALIAIGAAMKILASALNDFGSMDWGNIVKGLKAMGIALAEITIAMTLLPTDMISKATGLVIVGAALKIIASAMIDLGGMNWEQVKLGLIALGGALGILAIGLYAMNDSIAGSAALVVAAGALALLTPTLLLLGSMSWESIVKGLVDLAAVIAIFGISATLLTPIIPSMFGLAGALALLGVSMLGIGAGLALVGVGLAGVAAGFAALAGVTATGATAIVAALAIIVTGVAALIPAVMAKIGEGIVAFIKVFTDSIPAILECITKIIKAIADCIVKNIPTILDCVFKTLDAILDAILKWTPKITQKVINIILEMLKIMKNNIPKFVTAATDIIVAFIKGISDNLPRIIDSAIKLIITFINGLADGIRNNSADINSACLNLVTAIIDGVTSLGYKFVEAGTNAVKGYIKGLGNLGSELWNAGSSLGTRALNAAKKALDEHSPSKAFFKVGSYATEGFVNGLTSLREVVSNTGTGIGNTAISSISNAISGISNIVNGNIDSDPVIRPVLDLSNIQNGSNKLYSMMNDISDYSLNGSLNTVNSTAGSIQRKQLLNDVVTNDVATTGNTNNQILSKQPVTLQLMLQNGRAIAEYIIDDVDTLMGNKNKITGRMVGV